MRYNWNEIAEYYKSHSFTETREHFGFAKQSWHKAVKRGAIVSRGYADRQYKLDEVLVANSKANRMHLKKRLLNEGLLSNVCEECGLEGEWNNKPLNMHLDHINGVKDDNRLENLRMLCPNCHAQTDTYGGKNIGG